MAQRADFLSRLIQAEAVRQNKSNIARAKTEQDTIYLYIKRAIDVCLASIFLIVLSPLLLFLAIAIRLDSPGPAFLTQRRVGKNGRIFDFYKLRSMYQDRNCQDRHREFARQYINGHHPTSCPTDDKASALYKACTAKQVTRVGRFLRKTSLDELPQLLNILKGDMSFVGPRPSIQYELEEYAQWHKKRLQVVPGLSGWAQIHGRSSLAFDEIVTLDLEYIKTRSLRMDLYILLKTIPVVLSGRGAG